MKCVYLEKRDNKGPQREISGLLKPRVKLLNGYRGILGGKMHLSTQNPQHRSKCQTIARSKAPYHEGQDEAPDVVSDLGGNVVAKLLQRGQKALQLAQLASPTGGRQLLVCQR